MQMTPVANPTTQQEYNYRRTHEHTASAWDHALLVVNACCLCLSCRAAAVKWDNPCF